MPAWIDRVAQWSWRLLVAAGLVALFVGIFVAMPLVVIPMVLAVIFAATLDPLVQRLMSRGQSRPGAAAIAVGGTFVAVLAIMVITFVSSSARPATMNSAASTGADTVNSASGGQLGLLVGAVAGGGDRAVKAVAAGASAVGEAR